jgi:hypothetical protein
MNLIVFYVLCSYFCVLFYKYLIFSFALLPYAKIIRVVYYVMRNKNEVLCAAAGRLTAERSEADKPAKAHKTIVAPNNIYYFFFKPS